MTDSLRDQLLGLGFKPSPAPPRPDKRDPRKPASPQRQERGGASARQDRPRPPQGAPRGAKGGPGRPAGNAPRDRRSREEIDLAKAYAIRAQKEKDERIAAEAERQEQARLRREARAKLGEFVKDKALNEKDADIARHFPYGGKIKRIYVTAEQLRALNAGELGVVQLDGRYVLVTAAVLDEAEAIFPQAVALRVDPNATPEEDPYSDPRYQVPDDLVW